MLPFCPRPILALLLLPLASICAGAEPAAQPGTESPASASPAGAFPRTAAELFQPTKIWTVQLTVAPDQFTVMQPKYVAAETPADVAARGKGVAARLGWVMEEVTATLDFEGTTLRNVGLRYKGNGTFFSSKGSLKISLKADLNKQVKGQKLAGLTTLNFHSNVRDPSGTNELLAYRLFRAVGVAAPRVTYARVYLTVPSRIDRTYVGLYSIVENVDDDFARENFGRTDGAIFKPTGGSGEGGNFFGYRGPDWAAYEKEWDAKSKPTDAQKQRVIDFAAFVSLTTDSEFAAHISKFAEVEDTARQFATVVWLANFDGILANGQNLYAYLDAGTGRFRFIPWDQDESWGAVVSTQDIRNTLNIYKPWNLATHWFFTRLFGVEAFRKTYFETLARITLDYGRPDFLGRQQDEIAAVLRPAFEEESAATLALFNLATSEGLVPRLAFGRQGPPLPFDSIIPPALQPAPYLSIKAFAKERERSVLDQLHLLTGPDR